MPSVARFSIAPVRSLGLEHPTEIDVTEHGVVEDRRFYLTDDSNRLVDRIVVGRLVVVSAHTDPDATTLRMTFPDGSVIEDEVKLGDPVETHIHGRTGVGHVVIGPWAAALAPIAGRPIILVRCDRPGGTRAGNPTSIISDGSLQELAANAGVDEVDPRRFRMLIDLEGARAHEEDTWIGGWIAAVTPAPSPRLGCGQSVAPDGSAWRHVSRVLPRIDADGHPCRTGPGAQSDRSGRRTGDAGVAGVGVAPTDRSGPPTRCHSS